LEVFFLSFAKIRIFYHINNQFITSFSSFCDSPYLGVAVKLWLLVFGGLSIEEDMQHPGFGSYKEIYSFYMEKLKTVRQERYPKIV